MKKVNLPYDEHAMSRYATITTDAIHKIQEDYFAERDLSRSIPDVDETRAAVIVVESLEADRLLRMLPEKLFNESFEPLFGPLTDWPQAVMADILLQVSSFARDRGNDKKQKEFWALGWAMLEETLNSPVASPMLWYEDIFFDVGQELRRMGNRRAIEFFKRSLAHSLYVNQITELASSLRDLADTYLWIGEYEEGLRILEALIRNDPSDIWNYNTMAISFDHFGLTEIGAEATRRGIELAEATGDPEDLRKQLHDSLDRMKQSEHQGREAEVDPEVLADLRAALTLDFDAGEQRSDVALCHELAPDVDQMPRKRRPETPDLPPPDVVRRRFAKSAARPAKRADRAQPRATETPDLDLGRNDPCWCGSGKKYKHCHMRSDQDR